MRRWLYILAALIFLNASTELHQLAGLPFLLEHYRHHKAKNPAVSFLDFLRLHYAGIHPNDMDNSEDTRLPFKSTISLLHTDIPVLTFTEITAPIFNKYTDKLFVRYTRSIPHQPVYSIFHPPRLA